MTLSGTTQTNVHRVDGVLFVQWALFLPDGVNSPFPLNKGSEDNHPNADGEPNQHDHHDGKVSNAVNRLRDAGYLMLQPEDETAIWVFELPKGLKQPKEDKEKPSVWVLEHSKPTRTTKDEKAIDYAQVLGACGFTKSRAGSLRALDLKDARAADPEEDGNEYPSLEVRIKAVERLETRTIYQHFITAVIKTMLYSLAVSERYIPVTADTFLDTQAFSWNSSRHIPVRLSSSRNETQLSTLNVQWFPSGTLIISSSYASKLVWPHSHASILNLTSRRFDRSFLTMILAPLGMIAEPDRAVKGYGTSTINTILKADGLENQTTILGKCNSDWIKSVVAMLRCYGVSVPIDTQWAPVRVPIHHQNGSNENSASSNDELILWPASLCFLSDFSVLDEEDSKSWAWDDGSFEAHDPLANAEIWYLGREARQRLEAQRQEDELKAEANKSSPLDEREYLGTDFPNSHKFLDAQTASGIYPTPPDGQPFNAGNLATTGESESARPAEETSPVNSRTTVEGASMHADSTTPNTHRLNSSNIDQDGMDEDDLFGGMNSGMFTATGLTEDDFNFFDERDDSTKAAASDPVPSIAVETPMNEPHVRKDSMEDEDWDMDLEESPDKILEVEEFPQASSASDLAIKSGGTEKVNSHHPLQVDEAENVLPTVTQEDNLKSTHGEHESFEFYDFSTVPDEFKDARDSRFDFTALDQKYSTSGKYASDLADKPVGQPVNSSNPRNIQVLPYLDLLHKQDDSDESSLSEDEMSRSRSPSIIFQWPSGPTEKESSNTTSSILKRKRSQSQPEDMEAVEGEHQSQIQQEKNDPPVINLSVQDLILSRPPNLLQELATPPRPVVHFVGQDREFIKFAQIVTEQAVLESSFDSEGPSSFDPKFFNRLAFDSPAFENPLPGIVTRFFPHSKRTELSSSIATPEQQMTATYALKGLPKLPNRLGESSKSVRRPSPESESIFELPGPNVLAHRVDSLMELSSMALNFWVELGLAPCKGAKNVQAVCVVPQSEPIRRAVATFHDAISGTWQSMRFGNHIPLRDVAELSGGCLEVPFTKSDMDENYARLASACGDLGQLIRDNDVNKTNVVVYMANPHHPVRALPYLCRAFAKLKDSCDSFVDARNLSIVLKVVPLSTFVMRDTIALPSPIAYRQLARDVYDLSALLSPSLTSSTLVSSSLVQLAGEIPKKLDFRLNADTFSPLAISDSTYHVGYSYDEHGQWLVMALTDARGARHWKASYNLRALASDSGLENIFKDIWEIALDIIGPTKAYSRLVITRDEHLSSFEINAWTSLASDLSTASISLTLVSLDLYPPLQLSRPPPPPPAAQSDQPTMPSTPLTPSTPGPNTPTSVGPLDTSSIDPSLRLISTEDIMWAVLNVQPIDHDPGTPVCGHGLLVMNALVPDAIRESRGESFRSIAVKIVYHTQPCVNVILRDLLKSFKALGTLAKARGVIGARGGLIPWHIAVAREARMALDASMHWED